MAKGLRGGGSRARKRAGRTERRTVMRYRDKDADPWYRDRFKESTPVGSRSRSIEEIKAKNKRAGRHWFEKDTLRFFKSRVHSTTYQGARCTYFVTSEQGPRGGRRYSVRRACGGQIGTVGEFQAHGTRAQAHGAAKRAAARSKKRKR